MLRVTGLTRSFGAVRVVDGVDVELAAGTALGVVGPNGAGKTTLLNLLDGVLRPDAGRIELGGRDLTRASAADRCRAGIGRTYQTPRPFTGMTVFENVLVGAVHGARLGQREAAAEAVDALDRTGLSARANARAGDLRLLDRKRLELARALACRPTLLLLDEIAGGLTEHEARELVDELARIKAQGVTMIWIEHVVHALLAIADRLFVINFGQKLAEGEPRAVMDDPQVRRVYMGMEA